MTKTEPKSMYAIRVHGGNKIIFECKAVFDTQEDALVYIKYILPKEWLSMLEDWRKERERKEHAIKRKQEIEVAYKNYCGDDEQDI